MSPIVLNIIQPYFDDFIICTLYNAVDIYCQKLLPISALEVLCIMYYINVRLTFLLMRR